jgi:hypothetical protein
MYSSNTKPICEHFKYKDFLFFKKKEEDCTWLEVHLIADLLTFLLTKHVMDCDNVFLKDYSYSQSAVCSAPSLVIARM